MRVLALGTIDLLRGNEMVVNRNFSAISILRMALTGVIMPWYGLISFLFTMFTIANYYTLYTLGFTWETLGLVGLLIIALVATSIALFLLIVMPLVVFIFIQKNDRAPRWVLLSTHIGSVLVLGLCVLNAALFMWLAWGALSDVWGDARLGSLAILHALIFTAGAYAAFVMVRELRRINY